jgi:hypothetical protein
VNASLHVLAPRSLTDAVKEAAARELTSNSEYVRRAVIARLRADGIDPRASPRTRRRGQSGWV